MAYVVINKTGCCERKGNLQIRFDFFLEPTDPRYSDCNLLIMDVNSAEYKAGYKGKVVKDATGTSYIGIASGYKPSSATAYNTWLSSLPKVYQLVPFHSHFAYFDPDVTDEEIKAEMNYHLPNFYKAYQDEWDKVAGGMRHGFAVEKRLGCLDYLEVEPIENYMSRVSQVATRLESLSELQSKPVLIDDGKYYPATTIDVGPGATDRASSFSAGYTVIAKDNTANDTGVLDTVEIWAESNMASTKVGTFSGSGTSYDDRDYSSIGSVTSGAKRTFTGQSIDVTIGDYLGCYFSSGTIERDSSGYSGLYYASGDKFNSGSQSYSSIANATLSLYATGATAATPVTVTPTTLSLTITTYEPTVTATDNKAATPTTLSLSITTYAPTVTKTDNKAATPGTLSLTITTYGPTVIATGNKTVTPTTASLTITGYAPSIVTPVLTTPTTASLTITTYEPSAIGGTVITPSTLSLTITTYEPTVTKTDNKTATPITAELVITGYAPTIDIDYLIIPTTLGITITSYEPTVTVSSNKTATPVTASLSITGYAPTITIIYTPPAQKYIIELRTAVGALKQVFEAAYGVSYTQIVNEPDSLSFSLRGTDTKRSDIRWPYEFWLRNMVTGNVVRKFIITNESDADSKSNLITKLDASSLLAQLGMEVLQSDLTITDTPANIITALLTHQRLTPAITLGTIEITTEIAMSWTGHPTLLACINDIQEAVGGYFDVNDDRTLDLLDDIGEDKGQQIRQGKNIVELEKDRNWQAFATVLYPTGNGVNLSDITVDLEVATKSSDASYGYLTITQAANICFKEDTLEVLRYGDAVDYEANVAGDQGGTDWTNDANVLNIDWSTYASWSFAGTEESNMLGIKYNVNKVISGCSIRLQINGNTLNRIRVYYTLDNFSTTTLLHTDNPNYTSADGPVEHVIDFGATIEVQGLAFDFAVSGAVSNSAYVFSFWGWTKYFDESALWTNVNDRQVKIAIASYHSGDTYYLSYNYANFIKDFTAITTWDDEDGNGGEVSQTMSFNRADDAATLLAWAQLYLPTISYPPTTYQLQAALLNEVQANFSFEELQLGSVVSVVHDDLGIVVNARVLKIEQPRLDVAPAEANIEISSQVKTLADTFRTLWNKV